MEEEAERGRSSDEGLAEFGLDGGADEGLDIRTRGPVEISSELSICIVT